MDKDVDVGLVGLGTMGSAVARRLIEQGHQLHVYDSSAEAIARLRESVPHVQTAASLVELAGQVSMVITSLPHPDILTKEVVGGPDGILKHLQPGAMVVDISTSGPRAVQECGQLLSEKGIRMVDAPLGKGPPAALRGDLTIMLGGEAADRTRAEAIMSDVASRVFHCGELGAGQVIKLANNLVACSNLAVLAEAYSFTKSQGASVDALLAIMQGTYADSYQLKHSILEKALQGDFDIVFRLDLAAKDVRLTRDAEPGARQGPSVSEATLRWYAHAIEAGYGPLDWSAVMLLADSGLQTLSPDKG